ncbi:MarR family winged helix-turn-helix transcriptional regulator [Kordiimonas aquimaris]|uniref:MarR family winged helix-turn-helix transcriptional regulator n=1 Tax=Kordiimonas aquimaris TaxID=707591 RepID=UPI0021D362B0|nr:helix-turn-helix domain-containing protein [Kordiimonas aquimaris]
MTYVDTHPRSGAFAANQMTRLTDLINDQGVALLEDAGLTLPPRAVSTVLLIGEREKISAADIAKELNQPHQLVTQRIELLISLDLLQRLDDPKDGRRKIIALTVKGNHEFNTLDKRLAEAALAFEHLYNEIDINLSTIAMRAMNALKKKSLLSRINDLKKQ